MVMSSFFLGLGRMRKILRGTPIWGAARPTPSGCLAALRVASMSWMRFRVFLSSLSTGLATSRKTSEGTVTT